MGRKRKISKTKKLKNWEDILSIIYYSPGKSGAFYSAKKLQKILKDDFGQKINAKKIQEWLESQYAYTIHRNKRKHFPRNPIIAYHIDHNWQADLGFFTKLSKENKGFSCFLLVIDVVSRFVWVEPLKTKKGTETSKAFKNILKRSFPRCPEKLQTDGGTEFFNKEFRIIMNKNNIHLYKTTSDQKAAIAERAVKTIKTLISRFLSSQQTKNWVSNIQNIVDTYNNTFHSSIKMKPSEVNSNTQKDVLQNLYGFIWEKDNLFKTKEKFKIGDTVRLSEIKHVFKKGYEGGWTKEIFKISKILKRKPFTVYEVSDYDGKEIIQGTFYDHELSKVNIKKQTYWKVEKILKKKFIKTKLWYLVKFMWFDNPMWLPAENIADVIDVKEKMK